MKKRSRHIARIILIAVIALLAVLLFEFKFAKHRPAINDISNRPDYFGVTFSKKFADQLGLDWKETYLAMLDDLQVKQIRLPIYWDDIEAVEGVYDFSDYDFMIEEGTKRNVSFIISTGWRLPRWPECHAPQWTSQKNISGMQADLLEVVAETVNRYKYKRSIEYWQIENEPFLDTFGVCPELDEDFFKQEIDLVRSLDGRKILISASGELSTWKQEAELGDIFGTTMYRVVWNQILGYVRYPIPAWIYRFKAFLVGIEPEDRFIIELQAEPWSAHGSLTFLPKEESAKSMDIEQFKANAQYAINTGFSRAYLWGVEWWYWQAQDGDDSFWNTAKEMFGVGL